jgi:hypothetical protein
LRIPQNGHLWLISPTFYQQLLQGKDPKVQNDTDDLAVFFALLGSACVKAARKHVGEINTWRCDLLKN